MLNTIRFAAICAVALTAVTARSQQPADKPVPSTTKPGELTGKSGDVRIVPAPGVNWATPLSEYAVDPTTGKSVGKLARMTLLSVNKPDISAELLGAQLAPLSDAMRAQLNLPEGQGAYVAKLKADGPCARAGLKAFDVLVAIGPHPIRAPEDFTKYLRAAGENSVGLKIIRGGKSEQLMVRPVFHVGIAPAPAEKKEYYLGVSLRSIDEAVRAQLNIPAGRGVMVGDVVKGSPADAAGIKAFDIILEISDKAVESPEKFAAFVQAAQEKPAVVKILRGGAPQNITVTPAVRTVELDGSHELAYFLNTGMYPAWEGLYYFPVQADDLKVRTILDAAAAEVKAVEQAELKQREAASVRQIEMLRRQVQELQATIDRLEERAKVASPK